MSCIRRSRMRFRETRVHGGDRTVRIRSDRRSTASMRSVASVVAPTHGDDPPVGVVRQHEVAVGSDREDGEEPPSRHRRSAGNDGNHRAP